MALKITFWLQFVWVFVFQACQINKGRCNIHSTVKKKIWK